MQTAVHHAAVQGAQERMARSDESCLPMKRPVRTIASPITVACCCTRQSTTMSQVDSQLYW